MTPQERISATLARSDFLSTKRVARAIAGTEGGAKPMTDLYGPPQFRLNQGTAKKWRAALAATTMQYDAGQLSFLGPDGKIYASPEGLLAHIAEPNPETAWDGVSHLYDNEQFFISEGLSKRLKLRGILPNFTSFTDAMERLDQMAAHHGINLEQSQ